MTIFERGDLPKIEIEIKLTFIRTPISRFHWNIHRMINQKIRKKLTELNWYYILPNNAGSQNFFMQYMLH